MADQPPPPQHPGRFMDIYTLIPLIFIPPTALKWLMVSSITGDWIFFLAGLFFVGMWFLFKYDHEDVQGRMRRWYEWYQFHRAQDQLAGGEEEEELDDILEIEDETQDDV